MRNTWDKISHYKSYASYMPIYHSQCPYLRACTNGAWPYKKLAFIFNLPLTKHTSLNNNLLFSWHETWWKAALWDFHLSEQRNLHINLTNIQQSIASNINSSNDQNLVVPTQKLAQILVIYNFLVSLGWSRGRMTTHASEKVWKWMHRE